MGVQTDRGRQGLGLAGASLTAFAVALAVFWYVNPPAIALLQPDSESYLQGAAIRGVFYPALARAVGPQALPAIQLALYFTAAAIAARAIAAAFRAPIAGFFFLAFVGANPELVKNCFTVLSEAPSLAAAMLLIGAAPRSDRPAVARFVAMGTIIGVAIDLRPTNWSWAPLVPIAAMLTRAGWRSAGCGMAALAAPLVFAALIVPPGGGMDKRDFAALNLFGKFALLIDEAHDPFEAEVADTTAEMRARLAAAPDFATGFGLRTDYAEYLRYGVWPELALRAPGERARRLDQVIDLARTRPLAFATDVMRQLRGFWTMPDLVDADGRAARAATLASLPDSPLRGIETLPAQRSAIAVWGVRAMLGVGFALTLALVLSAPWAALRGTDAGWSLACLGALALWGNWTLIAGTHMALPRYALGAWPFLGLCLAASIGAADRKWRSHRRP
jgi:hypothetical protein